MSLTRYHRGVDYLTHFTSSRASAVATVHSRMRITVYDVLDYLASGMTEDEILAISELTREDIRRVWHSPPGP